MRVAIFRDEDVRAYNLCARQQTGAVAAGHHPPISRTIRSDSHTIATVRIIVTQVIARIRFSMLLTFRR